MSTHKLCFGVKIRKVGRVGSFTGMDRNGHNSESAKYSKHLINRVLHGAPIIEIIFLREEKPVLALLMLSAKVATGTIFNVFGMTRPGLEPAPPASEANALTITLSGPCCKPG